MGKIENLEKYIDLCSEKNISINEKINFLREVIGVYGSEISNMSSGLDYLELEEQKRKDELELARLNQGNINVSANANNSNNININITLDQAIEIINQIPDKIVTKEEKEELEDKLSGIDAAVRSGKREKAREKIVGVLKFLADKGADALIAILPYLGQMSGIIQNI